MSYRLGVFLTIGLAALAVPGVAQAPEVQSMFRTPTLDGKIEPGEWNTVYEIATTSGPVRVGSAWDGSMVYFSIESPASLAAVNFFLDAGNDGWLNGADNFEARMRPDSLDLYNYNSFAPSPESAMSRSLAVWKSATDSEWKVIELGFARNASGKIEPKAGAKVSIGVGIELASDAGTLIPTDPRTDLRLVELTDSQVDPLADVELKMKVSDRRVVPGQTVSVEFEARNTSVEPVAFSNYTLTGEQRIADITNLLKVRGDIIEPGKTIKRGFSTDLPVDINKGAYAMQATMEMPDGSRGSVLSGFEVVDLFEAALDTGSGPMVIGKERQIKVRVLNNRNRPLSGTVVVTVPPSLAPGKNKHETRFNIDREDRWGESTFRLTLVEGVAPGEYPVTAVVTAMDHKVELTGGILVGSGGK